MASSLGGREALPGPTQPPALRRSPPARPPGPAPWLTRPSPASFRDTPESFDPAPGARIPAAPHSPRPKGEQRAREGGRRQRRRAVRARLTQRPLLPRLQTKLRGAEATGWHLPALPAPRVTRDRPRPACPPPPGATEGSECPASCSRCRPRREQSLVPANPGRYGVSVPVTVLAPFLSENECHQLGIIPTLNQNTMDIVTTSESDEFQDNLQGGIPAGPAG